MDEPTADEVAGHEFHNYVTKNPRNILFLSTGSPTGRTVHVGPVGSYRSEMIRHTTIPPLSIKRGDKI
jgi:hypothetical protein